MSDSFQPVVVVGAPRSGTNMLRDTLTRLSGVGTWPCDEINYIWRHGNVRYPSDVFPRELARDDVRRYVRGRFTALARRRELRYVVEKTCANSLRVGFVHQIVPDARFLFIVRNGLDAAGSALKRWRAELDLPYLYRKARFVPVSDLPYYAVRYLANRVHRLRSQDRRLAFWGPRLDDMDELLTSRSLEEVAGLQWKRCVDLAEDDLRGLPDEQVLRIRYETFVETPRVELERIAEFLEVPGRNAISDELVDHISTRSVGKGRSELDDGTTARLMPLLESTLHQHGYA